MKLRARIEKILECLEKADAEGNLVAWTAVSGIILVFVLLLITTLYA